MFTLHVVSSMQRGCLYEMGWPAFPPGSAHAFYPHKIGFFVYMKRQAGPLAQIPIARAESQHADQPAFSYKHNDSF